MNPGNGIWKWCSPGTLPTKGIAGVGGGGSFLTHDLGFESGVGGRGDISGFDTSRRVSRGVCLFGQDNKNRSFPRRNEVKKGIGMRMG